MKITPSIRNYGPIARAMGIVSAVAIVIGGVTFAALQSQQAVLTGNTIQSATADLRIGTSASSFAASRAGFAFQDVIPGGPAAPADGTAFYLKNYGTAGMTVRLNVGSTPTNTANVDLSKVAVVVTRVDTGTQQQASLKQLIEGYPSGGLTLSEPINANTAIQYRLQASIAADAFTGMNASVGAIDLVFSGQV